MSFQRNQRAHRFGHDYAQGNGDGEFEISVERKQDHENQHYGQWTNKVHLRFGLEKLAVFAAPFHPVALRQCHGLLDCCLGVSYRPLQITPLDAVLHADVAGVVFAINKGRTVSLADIGELAEWDLLPVGCTDQQISDLMRAAAELGLHADHKIEQLLPLNDLRDRLPADCGRNHSFHIRNVDPVACNLVAIDVDQQAGLAKFAHHRELGEPGHLGECVLDLDRFVLQYVQVVTIYL